MLEIKSPITGEQLQVAENDFENCMNWSIAKNACKDLGNGWRLPTKSELELIYKELHLSGKGNFQLNYYWSSSEHDEYSSWKFGFHEGKANKFMKGVPSFVRAVRSFSAH
jgi:hypothetical protein